MTSTSPSPASKKSQSDPTDDRELYVVDDFGSIPWLQARPLTTSFGHWIGTAWRYKVLRKEDQPKFLVECGRFVSARHVPKRIQKYFDQLMPDLKSQGFIETFQGTVASLGPYSTATLGMSRKDGEIHFFATRVVTQINQQIHDEQYFGFISWLADESSIWTFSKCSLPSFRQEVDRMVLASDTPNQVLRKHEERIRKKKLQRVKPANFFESYKSEYDKQVSDWEQKKIIRTARPAEITRIRRGKA